VIFDNEKSPQNNKFVEENVFPEIISKNNETDDISSRATSKRL